MNIQKSNKKRKMKEVVTIGEIFAGWVWWVFFGIVGLGILLVSNTIQMKHEI